MDTALIQAGTGNIRSVYKALYKTGFEPALVNQPELIEKAKRIVIPGVGAFSAFMSGLKINGMDKALVAAISKGIPILGICVGMQALFDMSEEMGSTKGLGLLRGNVTLLPKKVNHKIPHTGWNQIWIQDKSNELLQGILSGSFAYFNHSYYCDLENWEPLVAITDYSTTFPCVIHHKNIWAVQFHPEKSQQIGLKILKNFQEISK